jgi:hypothetical protein
MSILGQSEGRDRILVGVSVGCNLCKHEFTQLDLQSLLSASSKDGIAPDCPSCGKKLKLRTQQIGCPSCRASLWIAQQLLGRAPACPHCEAQVQLPSAEEWKELEKQATKCEWTVVSSHSGATLSLSGEDAIAEAIVKGQVAGDDACVVHQFAPTAKPREACDRHFGLRRLYDPVGAWVGRAGKTVGTIFVILYLLAHVIGGLASMGTAYVLAAIFGVLAVVLTPTIIGLFIV